MSDDWKPLAETVVQALLDILLVIGFAFLVHVGWSLYG